MPRFAVAVLPFVVVARLAAQGTPPALPAAAAVATAAAAPPQYSGNCPAPIDFVGRITATVVGMRIDYQWERSNGTSGKILHVAITPSTARSHPADTSAATYSTPAQADRWRVGFPSRGGRFWERLHILAPVDFTSPPATVDVDCRG
ncbi:MAG TPA: hypothetical protein VGL65_12475 [Gemmatimonadales bacterium]|jgi:hypothetical protein